MKRLVAVAALLLAGCSADWNAFLVCKYQPFAPCPPVAAKEMP